MSASDYIAESRHEGELPQGATFFSMGKNRLNYISKSCRHAEEEYQQRLGPGAEMPKMRIWMVKAVELSATHPLSCVCVYTCSCV